MFTVGFTGESGGRTLAPLCDAVVAVPSEDCARIQECHEFVCHVIAGVVEKRVFPHAPASGSGRECDRA